MKKFILALKKGIPVHFLLMITGLLLGFVIASFTAKDTAYIDFSFRYTKDVSVNYMDIVSEENIKKVQDISTSWYTGSTVYTYAYVDIKSISIKKKDDGYLILCDKNAFILQNSEGEEAYNDSAAKGFLKHLCVSVFDEETISFYNENYSYTNSKGKEVKGITTLFDTEYYEANSLDSAGALIYTSNNHKLHMEELGMGIGALSGLLASFVFCGIFLGLMDKDITHKYDNKEIYRTPFHISFFKDSLVHFKSVKSLVMMAVLLSFVMISKFLPIPSGFGDLGISLGFIFLSVACMMFGPIPALMIGFLSDTIGYLVRPDGMFFIGYTFQAMLACFFYALCFYKTHITFFRSLLARFLVNFICNVIVGSLCYAFMYNVGGAALWTYILTVSLPKNVVYLLPQSLVLYFVLKAVSVPIASMNLISPEIAENISFF